eukprot:PLAT15024.1.p2 GENE.PLAT15024.1~~PLAT15024.1.p2  ORF type:complete len:250 (+),score=77.21 PLAT15024.1:44-751(+)
MAEGSYSFSLTTFSPSGKLLQIEYALKAVAKGETSLGIRATNGVVVATEKTMPTSLIEPDSVEKVSVLSEGAGAVYAGIGPDFRVLTAKGRKRAARYKRTYLEEIPTPTLVRGVATVMQEFTQSGGVRPFGVSMLVAGYDDDGPQLYQVDPSGAYFGWKATAVGSNFLNAKTFLERRYREEMELEDAIHTALLTLKEGFEGEMDENNIEVGVIGEDRKFRILTPAEVRDYLDEVE